ncbi:hypothetical protein ACIQWR_09450 [Streptomyces sp. NPDC098789]|uniref:hypothetical protein n=1 Tax=Streptomyces sp. NPDC098789 TaxID=3366098 RepID=UPI003801AFA9
MEQPLFTGTAHDPSGTAFAVFGISTMPTDWAQVFEALAGTVLTVAAVPDGARTVSTVPLATAEAAGAAGVHSHL